MVIRNWFGGVYKDARDYKNFFRPICRRARKIYSRSIPISHSRGPEKGLPGGALRAASSAANWPSRLNFHLGDRITLVGDIYPVRWNSRCAGSWIPTCRAGTLYFNREYLEQSLTPAQRGTAGMFTILCESPEAVPRIARRSTMSSVTPAPETKTESERAFSAGVHQRPGERQSIPAQYLRRRDVYHPAGGRQHDGDDGSRAGTRSGYPQDAGIHAGPCGDDSGASRWRLPWPAGRWAICWSALCCAMRRAAP